MGAANCCKLSRLSKMEVCYNITAVRLFGSSRLGKQFSSNFAVILVKMRYLDNQVAKLESRYASLFLSVLKFRRNKLLST